MGGGAVGGSLAAALRAAGMPVRLWSRDPSRVAARWAGSAGEAPAVEADLGAALAGARRVVVCVSDSAVAAVARHAAEALGGRAPEGACAWHTAGALPPESLAPLGERGFALGLFHPLQPFPPGPPGAHAGAWREALVTLAGEAAAVEAGRALASALGARALALVEPAQQARYHAAAALLSNGLVALFELARGELTQALGAEGALLAARALLGASAGELAAHGPVEALTGPLSRGEVELVREHLATLAPEASAAYRLLARGMLALARERGLEAGAAEALEGLLEG